MILFQYLQHFIMSIQSILVILFLSATSLLSAQDQTTTHLAEAKSTYNSGELEATRFALQQSLNELNLLIGQRILDELPEQLGTATALSDSDAYNGSVVGYTGVYIDRTYQSENKEQTIQLNLIHDSPLMSGLTTFLANPLINALSGRKMVKIDGYKTALEESEGTPTEFSLYVPFGKSLLTMSFEGFESENEVLALAKLVPVGKIVALAE